MSSSPSRTRLPGTVIRRWLARGALALSLSLLPQVVVPSGYDFAAQAESSPAHKRLEDRPNAKIDKVGVLKAGTSKAPKDKAAAASRETPDRLKKAVWPKAGKVTAEVGAASGSAVTVGGLAVKLAQEPAAPASEQAKSRTQTKATGPAEEVALSVLPQTEAKKAGVNGVLLTVDPAGAASKDSAGDSDKLRVSLDYSSFNDVYGGNFGPRLRLVALPACALTTPEKASCRTQTPVTGSDNNTKSQTLTGTVSARALADGAPMLLAAAADSSGGGGDYASTPLSPTATWEAGGSTGDFTWNYPLRVPPATAGPSPNLSISYNSASVDGRTAGENNQTSVIGEGFSITESYIERKYASCKDDGQAGKGDLCWKYANATLVLNGKAVELVNPCADKAACDTAALSQASGGSWKVKNEDGSRIEHLTGATGNGDDNTEYWKVTDASGIQYFFGKHQMPGWSNKGTTDTTDDDPVTNSVWTVPVFGDDSGEPCYKSTGFADSSCSQAWRWNLDYVVDTHDNASTYWYTKEANYYSKNADTTVNGTAYTRGGHLDRIDYGQRSDLIYTKPASQQVRFTYAERCVTTDGCTSLTTDTKANWPDVPFDMICAASTKCSTQIGPSFFTRKRLTDITTSVWTGTGTTRRDVDTWHLDQNFPDTGDASSASLWLKSIKNTGKANTTAADMPPVVFGGMQLSNHVEGSGPDTLRYIKWRVRTIRSETGSTITVNYTDPDCIWGTSMPTAVDKNTRRCFPVKWSQSGATPVTDWFHKYVVSSVFQDDPYGHGDTVEKYYDYQGGAGWAYSDDEGLTKTSNRTWSQWRGYGKVLETSGDTDEGPRSKKLTLYMRGLNGEKELDGTARVEKVTDSTSTAIDDARQYAGFVRETIAYNGTEEISGTINNPWSHKTGSHTYSWGTTTSWIVQADEAVTRSKTSTGTRTVKQKTTYDTTYGMPITVEDTGDIATTGDESCVRTTYARNTSAWLVNKVSRTETYSVGCTLTPVIPTDAVSDITMAYDGQAVGAAPTKGDITASYRIASYGELDKKPVYQQVSSSTYDKLGRPSTATNALNRTVATTYVPDDTGYGPLTSKTTTDPKLFTSTTMVDPAWGTATKTTDANGNITEWSFDALGRLLSVWKPDRSHTLGDAASIVYAYSVNNNKETWVRTDALKADGKTYNSAYEILDSLLRSRQKQVPAPNGGRVISETLYDDRGLPYISNSQIHDNNAPSGTLANTFPGSTPASTGDGLRLRRTRHRINLPGLRPGEVAHQDRPAERPHHHHSRRRRHRHPEHHRRPRPPHRTPRIRRPCPDRQRLHPDSVRVHTRRPAQEDDRTGRRGLDERIRPARSQDHVHRPRPRHRHHHVQRRRPAADGHHHPQRCLPHPDHRLRRTRPQDRHLGWGEGQRPPADQVHLRLPGQGTTDRRNPLRRRHHRQDLLPGRHWLRRPRPPQGHQDRHRRQRLHGRRRRADVHQFRRLQHRRHRPVDLTARDSRPPRRDRGQQLQHPRHAHRHRRHERLRPEHRLLAVRRDRGDPSGNLHRRQAAPDPQPLRGRHPSPGKHPHCRPDQHRLHERRRLRLRRLWQRQVNRRQRQRQGHPVLRLRRLPPSGRSLDPVLQ